MLFAKKRQSMTYLNFSEQLLLSQAKIIATLGPACSSEQTLSDMMLAGLNVCRLNFSHGEYSTHLANIQMIRKVAAKLNKNIAILADLQGPKLRIGEMEDGVMLEKGNEFIFTTDKIIGNATMAYMSYDKFPAVVKAGEIILIDDGKLKLQVESTDGVSNVYARVLNGGVLSSKKGVNLPHTQIDLPSLTLKDRQDAEFAIDNEVDWLALSFIRKAADLLELKELIKDKGADTRIKVVAKIEKPDAVANLDEILEITDAIMVARGDLGVEMSFEQVPIIQKDIIRRSVAKCKPVIVATQMLESMVSNFTPTRAETNDVANAILDGADAVMLSAETSVGMYPVETVAAMEGIIRFTEVKGFRFKPRQKPDSESPDFLKQIQCYSTAKIANQASAKAIVVFTERTAAVRLLASYRPYTKILVFTTNQHLKKQLAFVWGIEIFMMPEFERTAYAIKYANSELLRLNEIEKGDRIVYAAHIPYHEKSAILNTIRVEQIS